MLLPGSSTVLRSPLVVPRNLFWIKDDKPDSGLINPLSRGLLRERPTPLLSEFIHTRLLLLLSPPSTPRPIEENESIESAAYPRSHGKWQMIGVVECDEYSSKFTFLFLFFFFSPIAVINIPGSSKRRRGFVRFGQLLANAIDHSD